MTRALVHVGLAVVVALAPALCCCQARGLGAVAHAVPPPPSAPASLPQPVESCYAHAAKPRKSCCHEVEEQAPAPGHIPDRKPAAPKTPARCACCVERPTAAQTEGKPHIAAAEPTGELLPPAHFPLAAGSPAHSGLFRGLHPPGFAGADARFDALFLRHTLRC